ncbi:MAG: metal-dependent hydrolase [Pseudomonadota bacterium]
MQASFEYQPKDCEEIVIRDFNFDFPDDIDPIWAPDNPVRSHLFNGLSLSMPYLEPYLIRSILRARDHVTDPELLDDMAHFNRQEANHFKCHRRYNELLKANGYPELAQLEEHMESAYKRLETKSLRTQLAYSAGFESMTCGFTHWFVTDRLRLFGGNDPHVSSFWIVHMIEEGEHKTVAFDTYMAYSGDYWARFFGVFHGSFHVLSLGIRGMFVGLKKDKLLRKPKTWWQIATELTRMSVVVGPFMVRALLPGFNPRKEADPQWMKDWVEGYASLPAGALIPLVDTRHPDMPVPF